MTVEGGRGYVGNLKDNLITGACFKVSPKICECSCHHLGYGYHKQRNFELRVIELVNIERKKAGLNPLQIDKRLGEMAREKARDMVINSFFSHKSPTFGSPFQMMKTFGITYQHAGENIASGYKCPEEVMRGWMISPGHRANILKPEYTHIGVGYSCKNRGNYRHYWAQEFICQWHTVTSNNRTIKANVNNNMKIDRKLAQKAKKVAGASLKTKNKKV